ncbi:hypothetical protein BDB00DRAFT_819073 [Zychaea mexicana]|uniref:uncharacterized protein n=1 Tax=Zychaea mexicana TaxID=64656 RepID=UPI0022FF2A93|nr:uncharacterized protein BDB00DRAFT_819073 [Zychaea mexicana]KAI9494418.1 hypothetical protein BDB00DRAFT_819073 [Zychaea mexicana]
MCMASRYFISNTFDNPYAWVQGHYGYTWSTNALCYGDGGMNDYYYPEEDRNNIAPSRILSLYDCNEAINNPILFDPESVTPSSERSFESTGTAFTSDLTATSAASGTVTGPVDATDEKHCVNCECKVTSVWRRSQGESICNACHIYNGHRRFTIGVKNGSPFRRVIRKDRKVVCSICQNDDATFNYEVGETHGVKKYQCRVCYNH